MTSDEAINMLRAKLVCMKLEDLACVGNGCDKKCVECKYNYEQGNREQQKNAIEIAINALKLESEE